MSERRFAPATERNREPILQVLRERLPLSGTVLEVASGTGEHAVFFAERLPALVWQPSDADPRALQSIDAWRTHAGAPNLRRPLRLDACEPDWTAEADAVVCINMTHIAPWAATVGLIRGAARILPEGGVLYLYGPYRVEGRPTAASNEAFDASLRERNPQWGLREVSEVRSLAEAAGFAAPEIVDMPANNVSLVFRRSGFCARSPDAAC